LGAAEQSIHTYMPLSLSSKIWYWQWHKGGDFF